MEKYYDFVITDHGTKVVAHKDVVVAYIAMGGSGCATAVLKKGDEWIEGPDEIIGVYTCQEDAQKAIRQYIGEITGR